MKMQLYEYLQNKLYQPITQNNGKYKKMIFIYI